MTKMVFTRINLIFVVLLFCSMSALPVQAKHLLVYGDSLSAAYGMDWEQGWAQLIQQRWSDKPGDVKHRLTNASVSGETTLGGLNRLPLSLAEFKPDILLLELGANDGLRGAPIASIITNLEKMIALAQADNIQVVIAGISLPPSYGPRYIDQFRQLFRDLANDHKLPYIDLYMDDVFTQVDAIQEDGLHPTANIQPMMRDILLAFFAEQGLID